ncbi:hypothetical protein [Streptomyces exfoliatus]|uniref:hypothetical protein n=1 Tax=Streptomyces exfoliatus TaxID=1905 RepID=UPI003C2C0EF2
MATALALPLAPTAVAQQRVAGAPSGDGEQPVERQGNPDCDDLMPGAFLFEYRADPLRTPLTSRCPSTG